MSEHVWTENTKPDRPGIWASKSSTGVGVTQFLDEDDLQSSWPGAWCFLMDLPDIKDPPKYRDVTPADVGKMVETSNNKVYWGKPVELVCIHNRSFVVCTGEGYRSNTFARILDDGQPAKQPRECWGAIHDATGMISCLVEDTQEAVRHKNEPGWRVVKFREVID